MRKYTRAYPSANSEVEGCGEEKEKEQVSQCKFTREKGSIKSGWGDLEIIRDS